jgi:hypothetical protein
MNFNITIQSASIRDMMASPPDGHAFGGDIDISSSPLSHLFGTNTIPSESELALIDDLSLGVQPISARYQTEGYLAGVPAETQGPSSAYRSS